METKYVMDGFKSHLKVKCMFLDPILSAISGRYIFDVIRFDEWCTKEHGYDIDKHGSCADFVKLKFGEPAVNFIYSLLRSN